MENIHKLGLVVVALVVVAALLLAFIRLVQAPDYTVIEPEPGVHCVLADRILRSPAVSCWQLKEVEP